MVMMRGVTVALGTLLLLVAQTCNARTTTVFSAIQSSEDAVARKQQFDLQQLRNVQAVFLNAHEQRLFLASTCGDSALNAWDAMEKKQMPLMQTELFKWCALSSSTATELVAFLDSSSPILSLGSLAQVIQNHGNVAITDESAIESRIHGTYIQLKQGNHGVPQKMMDLLTSTSVDVLRKSVSLIPQLLHAMIEKDENEWYYLSLKCQSRARDALSAENSGECPASSGYCCSIQDLHQKSTVFLSRYAVIPYQIIPEDLPSSFGSQAPIADQPYVSTVSVKSFAKPDDSKDTPNFYDILKQKNCLPSSDDCTKCLREKNGANCHSCKKHCSCFCKALCSTDIPSKHVSEEWTISLPHYSKDPHRIIPKIVHQTWFEDMDSTKYPNMSRMVESFKRSGWDYRFYSDASAEEFLSIHFPPAVLEAYRAIIPGAFKADLFRYCVLLIHGGIYADVDIQLESVLDMSIPPDVGFMVPVDEVSSACSSHFSWS